MTEIAGGVELQEVTAWVSSINPSVQMIEGIVAELAPTNIPVLVVGESGTGKEMFANRIHRLSRAGEEPLPRISCASMNTETLSSELEMAAAGDQIADATNILFDEIGDLDPACQRSLLCALPEGERRARKGTLKARLISTTSRDLDKEIRAGRFRSELYYRINGVCLRLPPLRDRKEDIPALADFFVNKHAVQMGRKRFTLSATTMNAFLEYSWPGNIRELENVVKKIVALGDEQLAIAEIETKASERKAAPAAATGSSLKAAARAASREAERELILKALARTRWNRKRAAQELQISYKSLLYKLKQIGLEETT